MVEVLDSGYRLLFWASDAIAIELHQQGKFGKLLGTRRLIRAVLWKGNRLEARAVADKTTYKSSERRTTKYSHDRETGERGRFDDNVRGNWTLVYLPGQTREIFTAVRDSITGVMPMSFFEKAA